MNNDVRFEALGFLDQENSIQGILQLGEEKRLIVLSLNENMTDYKRREKLSQISSSAFSPSVVFGGEDNQSLLQQFNHVQENNIKVRVDLPEFAQATLNLILEDTRNQVLIFDCRNRKSFWAMCRALHLDEETMFALAELQSLKPENKNINQSKPAGNAHLLAESISKTGIGIRNLYERKKAIDFIKKAEKVKLPQLDYWSSQRLAIDEARIGLKKPMSKKRIQFNRSVMKGVIGIGKLIKKVGINSFPSDVREYGLVLGMQKMKFVANMRGQDISGREGRIEKLSQQMDEDYIERAIVGELDEEVSKDKLEQMERNIIRSDTYGFTSVNISDGYHFLRSKKTMFEFEIPFDDPDMTQEIFVLAEQDYDSIHMTIVHNARGVFVGNKARVVVDLKEGRAEDWRIFDMDTNRIIASSNDSVHDFVNSHKLNIFDTDNNKMYVASIMAHCLHNLARMHAPDFEETIVKPTSGKTRSGKHKHPYMQYVLIEEDFENPNRRHIGTSSAHEDKTTRIRHTVKAHPRYYRDENGEVTHVALIPPHVRGDAIKGFKAKGYEVN